MIILKIYDNQFDTTPIKQIDVVNELDFDININQESTANITIPIETGLKQFQKCEIYNVTNGDDILLFAGFIYSLNIDLEQFKIVLKDENWLMNKKLVLSDKSYSNKTPNFILNDLITNWNALVFGTYSENWQVVSTSIKTLTIDFKQGDYWINVLNTISEQLQLNWYIKNHTIYIDEIIGTNRTLSNNDYAEFVYDGVNHKEDNIKNITIDNYGNVSNYIIGTDGTTKLTKSDTNSINLRGILGEYKSLNQGDLNTQLQNYLDYKKGDLFNYKIETETFNTLSEVSIGDKVKLRVENANEYLNFDGDVIVNSIKVEYSNATLIKTFEVQTQVVKNNYLKNRLESIDKKILMLSL